MIKILRAIAVAFSLYSRIPMPSFKWDDEDMKSGLIFFPWVGMVIGLISLLIISIATRVEMSPVAAAILLLLVPLVLTGGFHVDGYMDVADARSSYGDKDKKLSILKDPHIGAFAVIRVIIVVLAMLFGLVVLMGSADIRAKYLYCVLFFITRCASGIAAKLLKKAKKDGMLYEETKGEDVSVIFALIAQLLCGYILMFFLSWWMALILMYTHLAVTIYYCYMSYKEFGGVTGDTAGYYVVVCECVMTVMMSVMLLF